MAAVAVSTDQAVELARLGIRDSKRYGAGDVGRRRRLVARPAVEGNSVHRVLVYSPEEVDRYASVGRLNDLEREGAVRLLEELRATREDQIFCDGEVLFRDLRVRWPDLVAEDKADTRYSCVAAASILAKVARDEAMEIIIRKYEPEFGKISGGGYVNAGTRRFLIAYEEQYGDLPPEARRSWRWREERVEVTEQPDIAELVRSR
jgi:ribonuclease HII